MHQIPFKSGNVRTTNFGTETLIFFKSGNVRTTHFGTETLMFFGSRIWSILHNNLKEIDTLIEFKKRIKEWRPLNWPCKLLY